MNESFNFNQESNKNNEGAEVNPEDVIDFGELASFEKDALVFKLMRDDKKLSYEDAEKIAIELIRKDREEEKSV